MLVLTRRIGERIVIGDHVVVQVQAVKGKNVRLAVAAPPSVSIMREELLKNDRLAAHDGERDTHRV